MQDQISTGIMEPVPAPPTGEIVHYVPHQTVVREQAKTTKMRIIYDTFSQRLLGDRTTTTTTPCETVLFDVSLTQVKSVKSDVEVLCYQRYSEGLPSDQSAGARPRRSAGPLV